MLDDEMVPETELFGDDETISETFGDVNATDREASQPSILTPMAPLDLSYTYTVMSSEKRITDNTSQTTSRYYVIGIH